MLKSRYGYWLSLSILVVILDQWSKGFVEVHLGLHNPIEVNRFFNWYLDFNHGAAWSFLSSASGWQRWALSGFSAVVSLIILCMLRKHDTQLKVTSAGLALILGGAVGNLIDRVSSGFVTDFIQWHVGSYYWPTFNIADSAVCIGAVLFLWGLKNEH